MTSPPPTFYISVTHASVDEAVSYVHEGFPIMSLGRRSYIHGNCKILRTGMPPALMGSVNVGKFSCIADEAYFFLRTNHHTEWMTNYPVAGRVNMWPDNIPIPEDIHADNPGDIFIGHDVWVGHGAKILPGVTIGNGAVIGAGAVVTKAVPAYSIYAGNPGKVMRFRFTPAQIEWFEEARWWDLDLSLIRALVPFMASGDFDTFTRAYDRVRHLNQPDNRPIQG